VVRYRCSGMFRSLQRIPAQRLSQVVSTLNRDTI
jgi:hypothetical protein